MLLLYTLKSTIHGNEWSPYVKNIQIFPVWDVQSLTTHAPNKNNHYKHRKTLTGVQNNVKQHL